GEVLDDAVVDDGELAVAPADVRVSVLVRRRAVGGPAGVRDSDTAGGGGGPLERLAEVRELPGALDGAHRAVIDHGDARGVIATVFKAGEALEGDVHRTGGGGLGARACISDDSTHAVHASDGTVRSRPRERRSEEHTSELQSRENLV